jgi:hypothetical protein
MKKTFLKISAIAILGLSLAACNNEEANKKAMEADQAAVDQMVADKSKAGDDEITKACMAKVEEAAKAVVDSAMNAKAGAKPMAAKPAAKPLAKKEPKKPVVGSAVTGTKGQETKVLGTKGDAKTETKVIGHK